MIHALRFFLSSIFIILLFASCEKELSYENGGVITIGNTGGTAKYTLSGTPGVCLSAVVDGNYKAGTALSSSNTIEVTVNVDSIGTYIVTTNTINGISFSGSGTFTNVGEQNIILSGSGTPAAAGTFSFTPGSKGCNFSVTVTGSSSVGTAVFSLGGSPSSCTGFSPAGVYTAGTGLIANNTVSFDVNVTTVGSYSISTAAVNGVTFTKTGNFTAAGSQTVTLQGAGVPTAAGDFTYTVTNAAGSCSFIITTVAAGPVATISFLDCAGAVPSGIYTQGVALSAANNVTIPVTVTTAGSYSVSSTAANGCTFSGSGVLVAGAQTIVLTGIGTPANSGSTSFPVSFGASNCSFLIDFLPGTAPSTDYFRCKMDGIAKTFNVDLKADPTPLFGGYNTVAVSGKVLAGSDEYLDITVNNFSPIAPGTFPHGLVLIFSTSYYRDENSSGWQPGDASSPAFSVIVTSITATRIAGTFSGQYIDLNGTGTNTRQITQGEFSVPF